MRSCLPWMSKWPRTSARPLPSDGKLRSLTPVCRTTSALAGRAYSSARQAASALHSMAVLQVFQAKLLQAMDESEPDPAAFRELCGATDLALQIKSSHLYLYSVFNNTDCVKALNSIKLEDRVSVMYNNKIKHSIFS